MNTILHIAGIAIKWYLIADVLALAAVGAGDVIDTIIGSNSVVDGWNKVFDDMVEKYKKLFV